MKSQRIIYFDLLKIISCIAVVMIHVISEVWYKLNPSDINFSILTIADSLCRFAVPVYFMISGALFLSEEKEITIKKIFTKYIPKILLIYIFWNIVYILGTHIFLLYETINLSTIIEALKSTILGHGVYHLTFLVTIIGFYLCVPILRMFTKKENKKIIEYAILLLFIFTSLMGTITKFLGIEIAYSILFKGYILYFLLGYYLHTFFLSKKVKTVIYILGILGLFVTSLGTILYSRYLGLPNEVFFAYLSPNILFISSALFLLFKSKNEKTSDKKQKIINFFSEHYFGIFLMHGLAIGLLQRIKFFQLKIDLNLIVLLAMIISFILSLIATYILRKIPIIKRLVSN